VQKKMKLVAIVMMLVGLLFIGWPFATSMIGNMQSKQMIDTYEETTRDLPEVDRQEILAKAREYNHHLDPTRRSAMDPFGVEDYSGTSPLTAFGNHEPFAYLWIPKLAERLPIYLSVNSKNLSQGVVLMEGTDIPIGEPGTHTVLAGTHNFLVRNRFSNIDQLNEGDRFYLYVFDKRLAYSVVQNVIFWPSENDKYLPLPDGERLSLLTTTPYPINNQRLLVIAEKMEDTVRQEPITQNMVHIEKENPTERAPLHQIDLSMIGTALVGLAVMGLTFLLFKEIKK